MNVRRPLFRPARPATRLLVDSLRGTGRPLRRVAAWSLVEAAPALASGWVLAAALDRGFLVGDTRAGLCWIALLAALYAVRALAERALFVPLADCVEPLRDALVTRVVRTALRRAVEDGGAVDAADVSRMTSQVDTVRAVVGALLRTARPLAVTLVATLAGLAALAPLFALLVAVPLAVALGGFALSLRAVTRRRRTAVRAEEDIAARTGTVLGAARDISAIGAHEAAVASVDDSVRAGARASVAVAVATAARVPIVLVGGQLPLLLILLCGPALVGRGAVGTGDVVGAVLYVTGSLVPALQTLTGMVAGLWSQLTVTAERLALATAVPAKGNAPADEGPSGESKPPRMSGPGPGVGRRPVGVADRRPEGAAGSRPPNPAASHRLIVDGLTFAYGPHAEPVLRDVRLDVPHGEHLVVVGASGVGKSTLASLFAGLERPGRGEVRLGGRPVTSLSATERTAAVALLPQEAYVFRGTLRENLCYLAPGAGTSAVASAVAAVGLTPLADRLGGLDAELADPATALSSGERQLIAAARTFLSPAPVVVLDEATSHLDMAAEAVVESAFAARPGTLVVVAHRLASALRGDRVLLLDGDRAVCDTHAGLLAAEPGYAALVGHWDGDAAEPVAVGVARDRVAAAGSAPERP
ncbi:ATP-binding cassette domain-containing protein [Streptomyces sp. NPDC008150]|uniref:ATP-binding cassette domain-containing protein n=1 Tax=Streptomyces sp. NPDC008150 TaxID=3364816 RepID=UPI0036E7B200